MNSIARRRAGARELLVSCLKVGECDRVIVLTDAATRSLAAVIAKESEALTQTELVELPNLNANYQAAFAVIEAELLRHRPTVAIFAALDDEDLLAWDPRYGELLGKLGARNAHMPALDDPSLEIGMAAAYREVAAFTDLVTKRVNGTSEIVVTCDLGTNITFQCDPARPWTPFSGLYHEPGEGGRLPQGETFCSPITARGTIAASVLGYPFNAGTGLLAVPAVFEIDAGRATAIRTGDIELSRRLEAWFARDEHAGRIGEFALGTNEFCTELVGNLLFDENVPGCHIALGHPFGDFTGACWESGVHVDLVVARPTICIDGTVLMINGTYQRDRLTAQKGATR